MAENNANQKLNDLLISKNFDPQSLDNQGKPASSPADADLFSFDYKGESGQDYGTVVIMLNDENDLNVYFGDNIGKSMEGDDKKVGLISYINSVCLPNEIYSVLHYKI